MFPADRPIKFLHTRQKAEVSFGSTDPAVLLDPPTHIAMDLLLRKPKAICTAAFHAQAVMSNVCSAKARVSSLALKEVGQADRFLLLNPHQLPGGTAERRTRSHPPYLQKAVGFGQTDLVHAALTASESSGSSPLPSD